MFGMYLQDTDTHKGYVRWVSEDAKGWKPRVFDASITGIMVGGFFGLVYFILVVFGLREMTSAFRPIDLLGLAGAVMTLVSVLAYSITDFRLHREYWKYRFPNLSKIWKW